MKQKDINMWVENQIYNECKQLKSKRDLADWIAGFILSLIPSIILFLFIDILYKYFPHHTMGLWLLFIILFTVLLKEILSKREVE